MTFKRISNFFFSQKIAFPKTKLKILGSCSTTLYLRWKCILSYIQDIPGVGQEQKTITLGGGYLLGLGKEYIEIDNVINNLFN